MSVVTTFLTRNIDVVYFVYGLSFFVMGFAVLLESKRASEFRLAQAMGSLAAFGLVHGIHEWVEMFEKLGKFDNITDAQRFFMGGLDIAALLFSFLMLVSFGIRLIYTNRNNDGNERSFALIAAGALAFFWLGSVLLTRWVYQPGPEEFVNAAKVLARYITGIPGALLAAWAIILEQRAFQARGMPDFGRALWWAAIAIALYGAVGQFFANPSFLFPANIINSDLFLEIFGVPVQLFRGSMAALMAIFVIRALRAFELESQQQLAAANEARLAAQQVAMDTQRRAREETEQLNLELQTAVQDLSMLFEVSQNLTATLDKEALLQDTLLQIARNLPRISGGLILLFDQDGKQLQLVASYGYEEQQRPLSPPECSSNRAHMLGEYVAREGTLALCTGAEVIPIAQIAGQQEDPASMSKAHTVGVPLVIHERVGGSLVLSANQDTQPFTIRDISLLSTVGGQLSIALENANLYQEVQEREALRGELLHQIVSAQEKERQRIARELHDGTGQTLTALGLGLAAANSGATGSSTLEQQMGELRSLSASALQELHDVIADLRPSVLDNLGLVAALRSQISSFTDRVGFPAQFTVTGARRRLDSDLEMVVFRIAQEALTNISKYAGAQSVKVRLAYHPDRIELEVIDDGCGFDPHLALERKTERREAWGLLGMQERAALVSGALQIESEKGAGTTIKLGIPLPAVEDLYEQDQVTVG